MCLSGEGVDVRKSGNFVTMGVIEHFRFLCVEFFSQYAAEFGLVLLTVRKEGVCKGVSVRPHMCMDASVYV
jgi:hypothetical protein